VQRVFQQLVPHRVLYSNRVPVFLHVVALQRTGHFGQFIECAADLEGRMGFEVLQVVRIRSAYPFSRVAQSLGLRVSDLQVIPVSIVDLASSGFLFKGSALAHILLLKLI
jgi:hypothetical protein